VGDCILRDDSVPSGKERGRWPSTSCGANDEHDNKFGRPSTAVSHHQIRTLEAMLDSRVEPSVLSRESPPPLWTFELREAAMRYHGLDLHKGSAAMSIRGLAMRCAMWQGWRRPAK
jgi:hypothetical protein